MDHGDTSVFSVIGELATPTLMRAARGAYARSIRAELEAIGVDNLPRNGAFILAGIAAHGGPQTDLPLDLGVTKQAVSQVIDTLVRRGYVERDADPDDRRRIALTLTAQGTQVLEATVRACDEVDRQLLERVSAEQVQAMRAGLMALAAIKNEGRTTGTNRRRRPRQFRQFSPIFPVRDLAAALAHYAGLGFETIADEEGEEYGFANREGIGLHLAADPDHDPGHQASSTYLYVGDADALYEEWSRPGIGGRTRPVVDTPYKLREGAHVDIDGNIIRFGSPMQEGEIS